MDETAGLISGNNCTQVTEEEERMQHRRLKEKEDLLPAAAGVRTILSPIARYQRW